MKSPAHSLALILAIASLSPVAHASSPAELCKVLRGFVESVEPDEKREIVFHTSWGENFKDAAEPAFSAKRCTHDGYEPAIKVCEHLMEYGSTEFAGANVKNTLSCLSKKTRFAPLMQLHNASFSFSYGSDHRGALIDITLNEDKEIGGMAFRLEADGY